MKLVAKYTGIIWSLIGADDCLIETTLPAYQGSPNILLLIPDEST